MIKWETYSSSLASPSLSPPIYLLSSLDYITTNKWDKKKPRQAEKKGKGEYHVHLQSSKENDTVSLSRDFSQLVIAHSSGSSETWFRYIYAATKPAPLWSLESSKKRRWLVPSSLFKIGIYYTIWETSKPPYPFFGIPAINFNELSGWERIWLSLEDLRHAQNRC